jgi:hypothetical protein
MSPIYFSLAEANALLPSVRIDIEALQRIKSELGEKFLALQQLQRALESQPEHADNDPFFELECEIEFLQFEAHTHVTNVHSKGIELKDVEIGLVDFPAKIKGVEVLLCWRLGEEQIEFYHSRESGFMGRRPISDWE